MPHGLTSTYNRKAPALVRRYESLSFEEVHASILDLVPPPPARALDVGAGSGRDAAALADLGLRVFAVEPSAMMRMAAQRRHRDVTVRWLDDQLPHLSRVRRSGLLFDFVLLSAVWMHLPL